MITRRFAPLLFAPLLCLLLFSHQARAYSYAAAGAEPVIEGWLKISRALDTGMPAHARQALDELEPELVELESESGIAMVWRIREGLDARDSAQVGGVFNDIFGFIIGQRLHSARLVLDQYQQAKVHAAKAKRYLDLMLNDIDLQARRLDAAQKRSASDALDRAMKALGSPGLFGAGRTPADPVAFERAASDLRDVLATP